MWDSNIKYYCFQHFLDLKNDTETPTGALGKLSLLGSPIRHTRFPLPGLFQPESPTSPALAGRFFPNAPSVKPLLQGAC